MRGKLVLITGAGRGIGRQEAIRFAEQGARLALLDIDLTSVQETAHIITEMGETARGYKCDVTSAKAVADVAAEVRSDLGEVDVLVNNAGIMIVKPLLDLDEKEIRRTFEVNTLAHFWTLKEFLPSMINRNKGHIVCICSMAGKVGSRYLTDYCASKFAADGLMKSLENELAHMKKTGIDLTTVYPMGVDTHLLSGIAHRCEYKQRFGPVLKAEDVAAAIVDGVVYNKRHVFMPPEMSLNERVTALLTRKALKLTEKFLAAGFELKKTK